MCALIAYVGGMCEKICGGLGETIWFGSRLAPPANTLDKFEEDTEKRVKNVELRDTVIRLEISWRGL